MEYFLIFFVTLLKKKKKNSPKPFSEIVLCDIFQGHRVQQVATGFRHTLILLSSGHVCGLGANSFGQLGLVS